MEFKDYYRIMGVARDATADDIKKAYRKLSRKYHPDVSKEKNAELRFKELGEAYEVLRDPEKRAAYDRLGANWQAGQEFRPPPGWNAANAGASPGGQGMRWEFNTGDTDGYSDFFDALFRQGFGAAGASGGRRAGAGVKGQDHHASIQIDLEDAYSGSARMLSLQVPEADALGRVSHREHQITFRVPKGIRAGQQIRLAGQGAPGLAGGVAGDLYLEVSFRPHRLYRVDGQDVYLDLPIAPWEAALGASIEAPTPAGRVEVKVPAGSASGRKLRVKGRGLPGNAPGDFYFVLQIAVPPAESASAKAFYKGMAEQFKAFHPRAGLADAP